MFIKLRISISVESGSQGNPEEFQDIHQKQQTIDSDITDLQTKLSAQSADISTFRSQVSRGGFVTFLL